MRSLEHLSLGYLLPSQNINKLHLLLEPVDQLLDLLLLEVQLLQAVVPDPDELVLQLLQEFSRVKCRRRFLVKMNCLSSWGPDEPKNCHHGIGF